MFDEDGGFIVFYDKNRYKPSVNGQRFDALNDNEVIDLSQVTALTSLADLWARHMTQLGSNVVIKDDAGFEVTLTSVNIADLDANYFVF